MPKQSEGKAYTIASVSVTSQIPQTIQQWHTIRYLTPFK